MMIERTPFSLNLNAYGGISYHGTGADIELAAQDTYYKITCFDVNSSSNYTIPDHTNNHITIQRTGVYKVTCSISSRSGAANAYEYCIFKNNGATQLDQIQSYRTTSVAGALGSASLTGITPFSYGDTVEIWVERKDGGAVSKTLTIQHINLTVFQLSSLAS